MTSGKILRDLGHFFDLNANQVLIRITPVGVVNSSVKHITPLDRLPEKATDGDMIVVNNGMGTNQLKIFLNGAWVLIV